AEDGIRDRNVTGVQTCALPISRPNDDVLRGPARSGHGLVHDRRFSDKRSDTHERLLRSGARVRPAIPQRRRNRHSHGLHRPNLSGDPHRMELVLRAVVSAWNSTWTGSCLALRGTISQVMAAFFVTGCRVLGLAGDGSAADGRLRVYQTQTAP